MIRLAISVEGQTEEEFVKRMLADYLWSRGVIPQPILLGGSGGDVTVERARAGYGEAVLVLRFRNLVG